MRAGCKVHQSTHAKVQRYWSACWLWCWYWLSFFLRNSCKVTQSQPIHKDLCGQVGTAACLLHICFMLLTSRKYHRVTEVDSVWCRCRTTVVQTTPQTRRSWRTVSSQTRMKAVSEISQWSSFFMLCLCAHVREPTGNALKQQWTA